MASDEMVTRVTDAILRAFFSRPVDDQIVTVTSKDNEDLGRAAIEVMREPTDEMINAMGRANSHTNGGGCGAEMFKAAIDEALK